ncbi:MAG: hypothetical protein DCF28_13560 [Alphaproteobacteria bacterium]|nr:MAG: hypothetical protein DCF28_13560 [Alphaproteobacteria bacterium]PZO36596.1 MAG: hypothetical protein DCE92_08730 [Alphaproteobacteria bacterium]
MAETIPDNKKARGRPRVDSTFVGVRLPPAQLSDLDRWIAANDPEASRPAAIRHLLALALANPVK